MKSRLRFLYHQLTDSMFFSLIFWFMNLIHCMFLFYRFIRSRECPDGWDPPWQLRSPTWNDVKSWIPEFQVCVDGEAHCNALDLPVLPTGSLISSTHPHVFKNYFYQHCLRFLQLSIDGVSYIFKEKRQLVNMNKNLCYPKVQYPKQSLISFDIIIVFRRRVKTSAYSQEGRTITWTSLTSNYANIQNDFEMCSLLVWHDTDLDISYFCLK